MVASIFAVLGGFAAMAVIVVATTAIAATMLFPGGMRSMATPGTPLPRAYLTANLVCSALAAFLGGFLTGRLAPDKPFFHGVALAALMCAMGVLSARQAAGRQPAWYPLVLCTVMPLIALIGAYISGQVGGSY